MKPEPLKGKACEISPDNWRVYDEKDIRSAVLWLKRQCGLLMDIDGKVNYDSLTDRINESFEDVMKDE